MTLTDLDTRLRGWLAVWRPVLPLFGAEAIVWMGFGALLPVLPLYFTGQGVNLAMLGVVVAAWPAARLVGEPVFGWLADRTARVPLMVGGLVFSGIFLAAPLLVHGAVAFLAVRALAGLATAAYDPAARGFIIDSMPAERHGEAFGWYGSFQMTGLLVGPAIGGLGASVFGGFGFAFVFGGLASVISAVTVAVVVHDRPKRGSVPALPSGGLTDSPRDLPHVPSGTVPPTSTGRDLPSGGSLADGRRPTSIRNRLILMAIVLNAAGNFAGGIYDVIWSIFLTGKGGSIALVGLTFAMWSVPVLILGPLAGRIVDRRGTLPFIVVGSLLVAVASFAYTLIDDPFLAVPIILFESSGFAIIWPALYAIVARGSPKGRSSTAQGVFGAVGTSGFIVASLIAGVLAGIDIRYPFYLISTVTLAFLCLALIVGGRAVLAGEPSALRARARAAEAAEATEAGLPDADPAA